MGYGTLPRLLRRFIAHVGVTGACASSTTRRNVQFDKVRARHRVSELRSVLVDRRSRGWYGQVPRGRVLEPTRREAQRAHAHHDHYERRPTRHSIRPQATTSPSGPAIAGLVQAGCTVAAYGITLAQGRIRGSSGQISHSSPQLRTTNEKGNFGCPDSSQTTGLYRTLCA